MKLRPQIANIVREISERTDLPVDTILEDALENWIRHQSPAYTGITADMHPLLQHSPLLAMTRHDGTELH